MTANRVSIFVSFALFSFGCGDTPATTTGPTCVPVQICDLSISTRDATDASDSALATDHSASTDLSTDRAGTDEPLWTDRDPDAVRDPDIDADTDSETGPDPDETESDPDFAQLDESLDLVPDFSNDGCIDSMEGHVVDGAAVENNDRWSRATILHSGLLIGQLGDCTDVGWLSCEGACEVDGDACLELSRGLCGCCECEQTPELSLCGADDYDNLSFRALAGDEVHIRIEPLWDRPPRGYRESVTALVWQPGSDIDPEIILPHTDRGTRAAWTERGRFLEVQVGTANASNGDALAEYVVTILNQDPEIAEIPYRIHAQVLPVSRGCPADPWDSSWDVYDDSGDASCEIDEPCFFSTSIEGQICPWDGGDDLGFSVDTSARYRLRISHLADAPLLSATLLGSEGHDILSLCPQLDDPCRTTTYFEETVFLEAGQWGIRVAGLGDRSSNHYSVSVTAAD